MLWVGCRFVALADIKAAKGLEIIDFGAGHASASETLCRRIIGALKAEAPLNELKHSLSRRCGSLLSRKNSLFRCIGNLPKRWYYISSSHDDGWPDSLDSSESPFFPLLNREIAGHTRDTITRNTRSNLRSPCRRRARVFWCGATRLRKISRMGARRIPMVVCLPAAYPAGGSRARVLVAYEFIDHPGDLAASGRLHFGHRRRWQARQKALPQPGHAA